MKADLILELRKMPLIQSLYLRREGEIILFEYCFPIDYI